MSERPAAALRKQKGAAETKRESLRNAAAGPADQYCPVKRRSESKKEEPVRAVSHVIDLEIFLKGINRLAQVASKASYPG